MTAVVACREFRVSLVFAAMACLIRPTNALLWIFLLLLYTLSFPERVSFVLTNGIAIMKETTEHTICIVYFFLFWCQSATRKKKLG